MKKNSILMLAFFTVLSLGYQAATAQITINIPNLPKIPKIKKPKKEQPKQEEPTPNQPKTEQPKTEQPTTDDGKTIDEPKPETSTLTTCDSGVVGAHLQDIKDTLKQAQEFRPGLRSYYVSTLSDRKNKYFEAALLPSQRKEYAESWGNSPEYAKCIEPALNELAAVARKTLPTYTGPTGYTFGTPAEKKVLLSAISDIAEAKVFKVGIQQANWMIEKDSYNFPTARYRYGVIWARYPSSKHEFCWIFWVNIIQDYAGGGTYGASYGNYISRALAGCPAGT